MRCSAKQSRSRCFLLVVMSFIKFYKITMKVLNISGIPFSCLHPCHQRRTGQNQCAVHHLWSTRSPCSVQACLSTKDKEIQIKHSPNLIHNHTTVEIQRADIEQMRHDACDFYQLWGSLIFSRWWNPKQWCETVSGSDAHDTYYINPCITQGSINRTRNSLLSKTSSH